jgi:hypothetical protein
MEVCKPRLYNGSILNLYQNYMEFVLYCVVLYSIVLYHIVLYCIIMYSYYIYIYIVLYSYYIILCGITLEFVLSFELTPKIPCFF